MIDIPAPRSPRLGLIACNCVKGPYLRIAKESRIDLVNSIALQWVLLSVLCLLTLQLAGLLAKTQGVGRRHGIASFLESLARD
jgi:hypothetical protein